MQRRPEDLRVGSPRPIRRHLERHHRVYFSDRAGGALYSCPTSGCGVSPKLLANNLKDPLLLATDGVTLYATLYQGGAIVACTLPDCAGGAVTLASGFSSAPYGIATDSTYVYWSEEGSPPAPSSNRWERFKAS